MAKVKWTEDQQKVIDLRDRNILVSAAAGSGKTAVLVQRIIKMVTDKEKPINIDRLLIVTFTKAAAAEMRERIISAIEKEIELDPENSHLQKQTLLIHNAQITTIDSFCLNIVRNYFNEIDLNPGFRIADENEISLLKGDIVKEVLEAYYEENNEEFLDFIEKYSLSKSDANIEEMIIRLHNHSVSCPWPMEWLDGLTTNFNVDNTDNYDNILWMNQLKEHIKSIVSDLKATNETLISICNKEDGPIYYQESLLSDADIYDEILACTDFVQMSHVFDNLKFAALSRKKSEASEYNKELVKGERNKNKDAIKKIKEKYFFQSVEEMLKDISNCKKSMEVLINLTKDFSQALRDAKEERNIIDFGDMEHFALDILVNREEVDGTMIEKKSDVAKRLSEYYYELLVDEYQDSNYVQEAIINAISKEEDGRPNVFMVGDVKQSIYKFRMAKPQLFMEKFDSYSLEDSSFQRIDLKKNFRSRQVVLDGINYIFEQIMTKKFGNIEYDELAALYPGADYPLEDGFADNCELLLFSENEIEESVTRDENADYTFDVDENPDDEIEYTKVEMEVKIIANRIKELVNPITGLKVCGKDSEGNSIHRVAEYKDIAILLRGLTSWSEVIIDIFSSEGIPVNIESRTGYFSAIEVRTMLNFLKILNNPKQDIPLTSVLLSPIGGFTNEELANMRAKKSDGDIYEMLLFEAIEGNNVQVSDFLEKIDGYRKEVPFLTIHELITKIMYETGYYNYVYAMPDGDRRRMNLDMLVEKAIQFENTSYKGLFNFIRFMEKINKYNIDMGEANVSNQNDNYVKVMTIHKSKGLEFPIVFVAGLGKNFNTSDSKEKILIHSDYGLAPDYVDSKLRIKSPTLIKSVISEVIKRENIEEEIRILYVALTRAKEKLILTGGVKDLDKALEKYSSVLQQNETRFYYDRLCNAKKYFDLVIPALMRHECFGEILDSYGVETGRELFKHSNWKVTIANLKQETESEVLEQLKKITDKEEIIRYNTENIYDEKIYKTLCYMKSYNYKYDLETGIKGKISVSELKKMAQFEENEDSLFDEIEFNVDTDVDTFEPTVPRFIKGEEEQQISASESGTTYHKVMELLEIDKADNYFNVKEQLELMSKKGYITQQQMSCINIKKIVQFATSDTAFRIKNASALGKVKKEQPFVIAMPAIELGIADSSENILIQGIIDLFFEEDDQLVLLDYKTDRVYNDGEDILKKRYTKQLDYYAEALERVTGKKVKEKLIYSFSLNKTITL